MFPATNRRLALGGQEARNRKCTDAKRRLWRRIGKEKSVQEFVEKYIAEQKRKLGAMCTGMEEDTQSDAQREKEARLIRLGMCTKEYSPASAYDAAYPYQEYKTGRYYRLIPYTVSEEEYREICRYDRHATAILPRGAGGRLFGKSAHRMQRIALPAAITALLSFLFVAVVLYLNESSYLFLSAAVAIGGVWFSYLFGLLFYTVGSILGRLDHMTAESMRGTVLTEPAAAADRKSGQPGAAAVGTACASEIPAEKEEH